MRNRSLSTFQGRLAAFASSLVVLCAASGDLSAQEKERPKVYDEKADARADLIKAREAAAKDHKHVLIQWGANWCGWCVKLDELSRKDRKISRKLRYDYEVVKVDVGRFDKHMELAKELGADLRGNGIPFLTILDAEGKVVTNRDTGSLEEGPNHVPGRVLTFLEKHAPKPLDAHEVLMEAQMLAEKTDRKLLVHLGAPWCGWCHRLEDYLGEPEIAKLVAKDFVDLKIDTDRMTGGKELAAKMRNGKGGGIPWMAVTSAKGETLSTSDGPQGNCGYPVSADEIAVFMKMLSAGKNRLTDEDMLVLRKRLEDRGRAIEEARRRAREKREKKKSGG